MLSHHPISLRVCLIAVGALCAATLPPASHLNDWDECLEAMLHPDLLPAAPLQPRPKSQAAEQTADYWLQRGKDFVRAQAQREPNTRRAQNLILMVGDGMGLTTIAAARNLIGGEAAQLAFERFPYTGLAKTYSVDKMVADSACTATAYLCGVKANYGTVGVNGQVQRDDCTAMGDAANHVHSIAKWALDAGMAAGLVTTTRLTHASPAGVYAHSAAREWEDDTAIKEACGSDSTLTDIAQQLVHGAVGRRLKVMLGGGRRHFVDAKLAEKGMRSDGRNLIEEYRGQSPRNVYVETSAELLAVNASSSDRLLGLFANTHLNYHLEAIAKKKNTQPTLEEMTTKAIELLQTNEPNGFFLFVEAGQIDMAHHATMARLALDETVEFSKAVAAARRLTSDEDTLIVATADHSHSFTVGGYQARGSDIFGVANSRADDDKSYLVLSYANGPSFNTFYNTEKHKRRHPEMLMTNAANDVFPATVPLERETHGGEDVAVYADGPWAHLLSGVYEQHAIPHLMAYAACIGDGLKAC